MKRRFGYAIFGCLIASSASLYVWKQTVRVPALEIFFFDTPGSPSVLIRTEKDERILINGGANADVVRRISKTLPFYSRRLDELVYTNEDAKHSTGLLEVANRYQIGTTTRLTASSSEIVLTDIRLNLVDPKKGALLFSAKNEKLLLIPFNPNSLTKKLASSTHPDSLIYVAQISSKPSTSKGKPKQDLLPWVPLADRHNLRSLGEIKTTVIDGHFLFERSKE